MTPNDCIRRYLGWDKTCSPSSERFNLQDLPDIDLTFGANVTTSDRTSAAEMFDSAIKFAADAGFAQFQDRAAPNVFATVLSATCLCPTNFQNTVFRPQTADTGFVATFNTKSPIQVNTIEKVSVYSTGATAVELHVREADGVETIFPVATLIPNQVTEIQLDYVARTNSVTCYFPQGSGINFANYLCGAGAGCNTCGGNRQVNNQTPDNSTNYVRITGYNGTTPTGNTLYGVTACIKTTCDLSKFFCIFAESFAYAALFKAGAWLLQSSTGSTRVNITTIKNFDERKHRAEMWESQSQTIIDGIIKQVTAFLQQSNNDACIICRGVQDGWSGSNANNRYSFQRNTGINNFSL